jgi:hypothetical protein
VISVAEIQINSKKSGFGRKNQLRIKVFSWAKFRQNEKKNSKKYSVIDSLKF